MTLPRLCLVLVCGLVGSPLVSQPLAPSHGGSASPALTYNVGLRGPDLRRASEQPRVAQFLADTGAALVRTLPFALVVRSPSPKRLRQHHDVLWFEEDVRIPMRPRAPPDDPLYFEQWTIAGGDDVALDALMLMEPVWERYGTGLGADGTPTLVAVMDDGFDLEHPDMEGAFVSGGFDVAHSVEDEDEDPSAEATDNHGTQTAGVIGARGFNARGVIGACPSCALLPVRLIGGGGAVDIFVAGSTVAYAFTKATDSGASVINNSWGPPDGDSHKLLHAATSWPESGLLPTVVQEALKYAVTQGRGGKGAVVVWSAGNGGESSAYDRFSSDPRVVTVSALDSRGRLAPYSDYGTTIDLCAPSSGGAGEPKVWSTDRHGAAGLNDGDYTDRYGGTSAAAALVSATAALIVATAPSLTAAQIIESLKLTARKVDPELGVYDEGVSPYYGYGRIDPEAAIAWSLSYRDGCTVELELCGNDLDDNCDGIADNPEQCTDCAPNAAAELCDGVDNDCNSLVDEYYVCLDADRPLCGPCQRTSQCAAGMSCRSSSDFGGLWCLPACGEGDSCPMDFTCYGQVCIPLVRNDMRTCLDLIRCGQPERCDGADNDCNGVIDDVAGTADAERANALCGTLGACRGFAAQCLNGAWACTRAESYEADETRCDGLDNDCDGSVDEHAVCAAAAVRLEREEAPIGCAEVTAVWSVAWVVLAIPRARRSRRHVVP